MTGALLALATSGCQVAPVRNEFPDLSPSQLVRFACAVGSKVETADGGGGLSVKSPGFSGQFRAEISARARGETVLEIQNPLGGTEVIVRSRGDEFSLEFPKDPSRNQSHQEGWAGVPARHLRVLFLGRIPCPSGRWVEEGTLVVDERGEVFDYRFRTERGEPWPEVLEWKPDRTSPYSVRFDFDKPEGEDLVPRQWRAKSGESAIELKWRNRSLTRSSSR